MDQIVMKIPAPSKQASERGLPTTGEIGPFSVPFPERICIKNYGAEPIDIYQEGSNLIISVGKGTDEKRFEK